MLKALIALLLLCSLPATAHVRSGTIGVEVGLLNDSDTALRYRVPYMSAPVVIDGRDDEWHGGAMVLDAATVAYGDVDGAQDLSGDLRIAWDSSHLYFYARVTDDELVTAPVNKEGWWEGDGVQFAFDALLNANQEMNGGRRYDDLSFSLVESDDGAHIVAYPWSGGPEILDVELAVIRTDGQRSYEWAMPWSALGPMSPAFLGKTGFGFSLRDTDAGDAAKAMAWTTGTIDGVPKPRYGILEFEAPVDSRASSMALPVEWNVVDRGNRFVHLPDVDANGTAVLLARSPTPRLVRGVIRVFDREDTVATAQHVGRIRSRPVALVWDMNEVMADLPDGSYTLEYQVTVPESDPVRTPLHWSKRIAHMQTSEPPTPGGISSDGLIAHWSFDDCDARDVSGNGHDGVTYGSPDCVDGVAGSRALRFDTEALSYALVDRDIKLEGDYTLSARIRLEDSEHLSWQFIVSRMQSASALRDPAWALRLSRSRIFFLREFYCCVEDDRWMMITATGSADQGVLYLDGERVLSGELTRVENEDDLPICIACTQGNSLPPFQFFKGAIDDLRVYGRALTASEVAELHQEHLD